MNFLQEVTQAQVRRMSRAEHFLLRRKSANPLGRGSLTPLSKELHCPFVLPASPQAPRAKEPSAVQKGSPWTEPFTRRRRVYRSTAHPPTVPSPEHDKAHTCTPALEAVAPNDSSSPLRCLFKCHDSPTPFISIMCQKVLNPSSQPQAIPCGGLMHC